LDTVSYPEQSVTDTINQRFVPLQVNTQEDWGKPIVERFRQVWTPIYGCLARMASSIPAGTAICRPSSFCPLAARPGPGALADER
jgi:hypothetical protein